MADYLHEINHAATETLRLVWHEHRRMEELQARIAALTSEVEDAARRVEFLALNPDLDDEGIGTMIHWETYFGPEKERYYAEKSKPELEALIAARRFSTDAQAGNLLQYGKLGLSLVHGAKSSCPHGRTIHGRTLTDVVWEGRNQAQHWDEGNPKPKIRACFEALVLAEPAFAGFVSQNMAFEVIRLLGWREFPDFERDMLSLA